MDYGTNPIYMLHCGRIKGHLRGCNTRSIDIDQKIEITGLDLTKGLERLDGDKEAFWKLLRSYAAGVRSRLDTIKTVTEDRLDEYRIIVHGIKGTSYGIFAEQVGEAAKELEMAAKSGDFEYISKHNPAFLEIAWKLVYDIDNLLSVIETEKTKPQKNKPDDELLLKLFDACENWNMSEADEVMTEIDNYRYVSDESLADWLRYNVDIMNFEEIVKRLTDYMEHR